MDNHILIYDVKVNVVLSWIGFIIFINCYFIK